MLAVAAVRAGPFALFAGVMLCIYLALSLFSFDPNDPSFGSGGQAVSNFGGPVGAWMSDLLFQIFGYGAWTVVVIGSFLALKLAGRPTGDPRRHIGWAAVFWVALCFVALIWPFAADQAFAAGGLIGETSVGAMRGVVGPAGTWLIVIGCAIAVSPVLIDVQLEAIANRGLSGIERAGPHLQGASNAAVSSVSSSVARLSAGIGGTLQALTERFRRPALPDYADYDYEREEENESNNNRGINNDTQFESPRLQGPGTPRHCVARFWDAPKPERRKRRRGEPGQWPEPDRDR